MNVSKPKDRIWDNWRESERRARYYSRRSRHLEKQHKWLTFPIALVPVAAVAILQVEWEHKLVVTTVFLTVGAVLELALLHFGSGGDIKAAKIMGNMNTELARQWRKLWIDQKRNNVVQWIEELEALSEQSTAESISHSVRKGENRLSNQCAEETNLALERQFGR